ncbi:MAG: LysR family transcriptional regulator [Desulfobacteraceae bacterium]|nr:LysR family transcriptional regulator [Desulfobacteraceae bacterium]
MELYQLKSFIEIAKTTNLTKAARELNISQSALSTQIKGLEISLGVALFQRSAKGMSLTNEGKKLLSDAQKVIHAARKMELTACEFSKQVHGTLNIGINTDPQFLNISGINQKVRQFMPKVHTNFVESQSYETTNMLIKKSIDIGFHYGEIDDIAIHSFELRQVSVCVVIPASLDEKTNELTLNEISDLPWVWTKHNCPFHLKFRQALEQQNLTLNQVADAVGETIVQELVRSGTGLALMRKDEAMELQTLGQARIWKGIELFVPLGISCLAKRKDEKPIRTYVSLVREGYNNPF